MHLIVGLGNPGDKYRGNRHNVGFMAVDAIASRHGIGPLREKFKGLIAEGTIDGERVLILKPQTYMNNSGDSIVAVANFYKLAPTDITVFYDEIDLAPAKVRVKRGGGNGGHNGLRSIDPQIGTEYRRVRIGVGHPGHKDAVMPHVLGDFSKADREWLEPEITAMADNIGLLLKGDDNTFMNKIALAVGNGGESGPHAEKRRPTKSGAPAGGSPKPDGPKDEKPGGPKAQSHIRAARRAAPQTKVPETGPMASMLKKLFGK